MLLVLSVETKGGQWNIKEDRKIRRQIPSDGVCRFWLAMKAVCFSESQ